MTSPIPSGSAAATDADSPATPAQGAEHSAPAGGGAGPADPAASVAHEADVLFSETYGREPAGLWAAPGRVNVIGEHTDYNAGFVLPMAIDRYTVAAAAPREDGVLRVTSARAGAEGSERVYVYELDSMEPGSPGGWPAYPAGVAWALRRAGILGPSFTGADLAFTSAVPVGAGLSSSAALECATAFALAGLADAPLSQADAARWTQYAENEFAGVPCGPLDQMSSVYGEDGAVLFIDTRSMEVTPYPFDLRGAGLTLLIIDTCVSHDVGESGYPDRRATCERAAAQLGVPALRDLTEADLDRVLPLLDEKAARRVRHVVTEDARVERFVTLLRNGALKDPAALVEAGALLTASHVSLRDDYEVSCEELDVVVEAALRGGAVGARLTGAGFGGSAIALVAEDRVGTVTAEVLAALPGARIIPAVSARGAHRVS